jgi:D-glycero-D-manno-heptose 1,7-bisphosphate phosphatase
VTPFCDSSLSPVFLSAFKVNPPLSAGGFGFPYALISLTIWPALNTNRAVFLDRDGTIIEEKHYLHRPEQVVLFPGAAAALKRLQDAGFKLIIISNQAGVGRGYFTLADVERVHRHLHAELGRHGVRLDKIYVAPEAPDQPSHGRKPSPQFLLDARDQFALDLAESYLIGDKVIDLECGWNGGVKKCLLVRTGYGADLERTAPDQLPPAVVVDDLPAAADWILNASRPTLTDHRSLTTNHQPPITSHQGN